MHTTTIYYKSCIANFSALRARACAAENAHANELCTNNDDERRRETRIMLPTCACTDECDQPGFNLCSAHIRGKRECAGCCVLECAVRVYPPPTHARSSDRSTPAAVRRPRIIRTPLRRCGSNGGRENGSADSPTEDESESCWRRRRRCINETSHIAHTRRVRRANYAHIHTGRECAWRDDFRARRGVGHDSDMSIPCARTFAINCH